MAVLRTRADTDVTLTEKASQLARETFVTFYERPDIGEDERESLAKARTSAQMLATGEAKYSLLVLVGEYGSGKSHLAKAALNHILQAGGSGLFVSVPSLLRSLREGFEDGSYNETLAICARTPFLVLDDYGANKDTEWAREQLYMLIDDRYEARGRTIVTTNQSEDQWEPRVRDRLKSWHNGVSKVVAITARSYRSAS